MNKINAHGYIVLLFIERPNVLMNLERKYSFYIVILLILLLI